MKFSASLILITGSLLASVALAGVTPTAPAQNTGVITGHTCCFNYIGILTTAMGSASLPNFGYREGYECAQVALAQITSPGGSATNTCPAGTAPASSYTFQNQGNSYSNLYCYNIQTACVAAPANQPWSSITYYAVFIPNAENNAPECRETEEVQYPIYLDYNNCLEYSYTPPS